MEIRTGYGTGGNRVTGPVHVGDPLTLLIYMRSQWGKYLNTLKQYVNGYSYHLYSTSNKNHCLFS